MLARADAVLAAIPVLVVSGLLVRMAVAATGIGTALLAIPLAPAGPVAAFAVVVGELFAGPLARHAKAERD